MQIEIRENSNVPIYRQIVNAIYHDIKSGALPANYKLPTVRDLAAEMKIARGTIKHAYDELQNLGVIEMTQGRGTFVLDKTDHESGSKKERAMKAIDALLDEMEELSFSAREVQIFFDLKLREREERYDNVRIALVDCNPEALALIAGQISRISNVDVYQYLLADVLQAPYKLGENVDLVITTSTHFSELEKAVSDVRKITRIVLTPTQSTVAELAKLVHGTRIGVLCASEAFAQIICKSYTTLSGGNTIIETRLFGQQENFTEFLLQQQVLIVPQDYLQFCPQHEAELVRRFQSEGNTVISYAYQIDGGSFLYLEEQIERIKKAKQG
ncbi:GntR family transcriptional regulator [Hydrogenoanaerobacterium sp.]|uniref:GntR family transcriptional regulator n=1 Tax=Hydrogenoanaerobacterium sp. TaxID=2953763 RepID=UPI00289C2EE7|nr:GntR family transcriptional regulator [Hydrogenoanaerobacterium sp.]